MAVDLGLAVGSDDNGENAKESFESLRLQIGWQLARKPNAWAHYKAQGLSATRFRWDVLAASGFRYQALYEAEGLNDSHMDTALKAIMPCE